MCCQGDKVCDRGGLKARFGAISIAGLLTGVRYLAKVFPTQADAQYSTLGLVELVVLRQSISKLTFNLASIPTWLTQVKQDCSSPAL